MTARAARAVGARHVLVLTNARLDRVGEYRAALAREQEEKAKELARKRASIDAHREREAEKKKAAMREEDVVTAPLLLAVSIAAASQFLNGYNTSVMNAPEAVVFPGHSTLEWSLAVSSFAIAAPLSRPGVFGWRLLFALVAPFASDVY